MARLVEDEVVGRVLARLAWHARRYRSSAADRLAAIRAIRGELVAIRAAADRLNRWADEAQGGWDAATARVWLADTKHGVGLSGTVMKASPTAVKVSGEAGIPADAVASRPWPIRHGVQGEVAS